MVKRVLELHRNPCLAEEVDHEYDDKYRLVEQMTNTALIGQLNILEYFGLTQEVFRAVDKSKATTLRFQASDSCTFLKEETVEIPMQWSVDEGKLTQTSGSTILGRTTKSPINRIVHHAQEFHWKVEVKREVSLYYESDVNEKKILKHRSSSTVLIMQSEKMAPGPEHRDFKPLDMSLSWLMKQIDTEKTTSNFSVDRQAPTTKTPCQNQEVKSALNMMHEMKEWTSGVRSYFNQAIQQDIIDKHNPAGPTPFLYPNGSATLLSKVSHVLSFIFVPVQPLLKTTSTRSEPAETWSKSVMPLAPTMIDDDSTDQTASTLLSTSNIDKLLNEQIRTIKVGVTMLERICPLPESTRIVSVTEASMMLLSLHSEQLGQKLFMSVAYVERILRNQLESAIGKSIQSCDMSQFLRYHNARFLNPAPTDFYHATRQIDHDPCGVLSIESIESNGAKEPIQTLSREVESLHTMRIPLNSATTVELTGKTFLHGWIRHRFGGDQKVYELIARAREFSSFVLVVGTMVGLDKLDPQDAIIIQNKDELMIPLRLGEIPTSKEFKDSIQSLSPEQVRFAEAFRSMQLGSSVIGICVIQIKAQLEILLALPRDALLKETKLTQDLMTLFTEHQVPSDLLSCDRLGAQATAKEKVDNVSSHTKSVFDVISEIKKKTLEDSEIEKKILEERPEVYVSAEGKKVRSRRPGNKPESDSVYVTADGMKVRKIRIKTPISEQTDFEKVLPESDDCSNDFTMIPKTLNLAIEKYSGDAMLRSTTLTLGNKWQRTRHIDLFAKPQKSYIEGNSIKVERNKAHDLLDAISRSGTLSVDCSELHVIVAASHHFYKDVINTIVHDNINPIEKLEMSTLLVGSIVHGVPAHHLIREESDLFRLKSLYPELLGEVDCVSIREKTGQGIE